MFQQSFQGQMLECEFVLCIKIVKTVKV